MRDLHYSVSSLYRTTCLPTPTPHKREPCEKHLDNDKLKHTSNIYKTYNNDDIKSNINNKFVQIPEGSLQGHTTNASTFLLGFKGWGEEDALGRMEQDECAYE